MPFEHTSMLTEWRTEPQETAFESEGGWRGQDVR